MVNAQVSWLRYLLIGLILGIPSGTATIFYRRRLT
jgi:hypothetical protein